MNLNTYEWDFRSPFIQADIVLMVTAVYQPQINQLSQKKLL